MPLIVGKLGPSPSNSSADINSVETSFWYLEQNDNTTVPKIAQINVMIN